MSITELYARAIGIGDADLAEATWLASWVKRHGNSLAYDHTTFRWVWVAK